MYKIYVDYNLICNSGNQALAVINPIIKLKANTAGSFTFTFPPNHPHYNAIERRKSVITVFRDDEEEPIFQGYCTSEAIDFYKQKKITCEGDLAYLNDSILRQHHYEGETVLSLLTSYINLHNAQVDERKQFRIGTVTVSDPNNYISCYTNMNPAMQEIKEELLDDLGGF